MTLENKECFSYKLRVVEVMPMLTIWCATFNGLIDFRT